MLIVGGGWAGLACAVDLAEAGCRVSLLEAAPRLGGRARSLPAGDRLPTLDNGQHLLLGACTAVLGLLERLGVDPEGAFLRRPLDLRLLGAGREVRLRRLPLPPPLDLLGGLLLGRGLGPLPARLAAASRLQRALRRGIEEGEADLPAAAWLETLGQPREAVEGLWGPLCLAALTTPPEAASARVLARVLREALLAGPRASDLLVPRRPLGELLPLPAARRLRALGARLHTGLRARRLQVERGRVVGVETSRGAMQAEAVVLAVPPWEAARLLRPHPALRPLAQALAALEPVPIVTAYLSYEEGACGEGAALGAPLLGRLDGAFQWVFDLGHGEPPGSPRRGLLAAVLGGAPPAGRDGRALGELAAAELAPLVGGRRPRRVRVLRERRAAFACTPAAQALRPGPRGPLPGLWLAGDHCATGYPATLEGAVRSGLACARALLGARPPPPQSGQKSGQRSESTE